MSNGGEDCSDLDTGYSKAVGGVWVGRGGKLGQDLIEETLGKLRLSWCEHSCGREEGRVKDLGRI